MVSPQGNIMDSDTLIQTIVERVLTQLQNERSAKSKSKVMVFGGYSEEVEKHIGKCIRSTDVELCFWNDAHHSIEVERYIIPHLLCGDMADLALGTAKDPVSKKVLQLLLEGKVVEVMEYEYKAYEKTISPALYKLYQQYEDTLDSFGLKALKADPEPVLRFWQKLITEKDVGQAAKDGAKEIHVTSDCVITPLAVDQAKSDHISIYKKL